MIKGRAVALTGEQMKWIAMVAMVIDHLGWLYFELGTYIAELSHFVGRLVMPIMAYFIASGYFLTKNRWAYFRRLLIFGLISQPIVIMFQYQLGYYYFSGNILLNFAMCLLLLMGIDEVAKRFKGQNTPKNLLIVAVMALGLLFGCYVGYRVLYKPFEYAFEFGIYGYSGLEYGLGLVLLVLYLWVCIKVQASKALMLLGMLPLLQLGFYMDIGELTAGFPHFMNLGWLLAVALLWIYDGTKGKQIGGRYVFYWFYPVHLAVIVLLAVVFGNEYLVHK